MTIRIIDIETTGTDPASDVEIASVDLLRDGTITNQISTLVRPGIPVPPESSAVHHLIDADLAEAPRLEEVLDQFRGADAHVTHNADFERSFLEDPLGDALCLHPQMHAAHLAGSRLALEPGAVLSPGLHQSLRD